MASQRLRQLAAYHKAHACVSPFTDTDARRTAATRIAFDALANLDLARIRVEPDEDFDPNDYDCDLGPDPEAFGTIAEYRLPGTKRWIVADSCWGHVGYRDPADPEENVYVLYEMTEAVRQFNAAWHAEIQRRRDTQAGRCPMCHGNGRTP